VTPAAGLVDFRQLDLLAGADTAVHRVDARAKVFTTVVFIACAMSFDRYAVVALLPFFAFPIALATAARLPTAFLLRKIAMVLPVAVVIGLPNVWLDTSPLLHFGDLQVSGGWVSLLSIMLRSLVAASASVVLVAVTGFPAISGALQRMGMPRVLAVQLLLLYRYLVVLGEEATRMTMAHRQRAAGNRLSMRLFATLVGRLLLRTWDRGERIYLAMCARGFDGEFHGGASSRLGAADIAFAAAWCALFVLFRIEAPASWIGETTLRVLG